MHFFFIQICFYLSSANMTGYERIQCSILYNLVYHCYLWSPRQLSTTSASQCLNSHLPTLGIYFLRTPDLGEILKTTGWGSMNFTHTCREGQGKGWPQVKLTSTHNSDLGSHHSTQVLAKGMQWPIGFRAVMEVHGNAPIHYHEW